MPLIDDEFEVYVLYIDSAQRRTMTLHSDLSVPSIMEKSGSEEVFRVTGNPKKPFQVKGYKHLEKFYAALDEAFKQKTVEDLPTKIGRFCRKNRLTLTRFTRDTFPRSS